MIVLNNHSLGWGIAKTLADHGAELAFTFQGEALHKRVVPLAASLGSNAATGPCERGAAAWPALVRGAAPL